jgi:hypothetical protein
MPVILSIIDDLTKGAPASSTYLELWCRSFDEMYVSLSKSKEMAFHAGFDGQRAERTWAEKIRRLEELGFISVKPGQAGPAKTPGLTQEKYNAFVERAIEIGALESAEEEKKKPVAGFPNPFAPAVQATAQGAVLILNPYRVIER